MANLAGNWIKHAWSAFMNRDPTDYTTDTYIGPSSSYRADRYHPTRGTDRSIITSVCNRIALDVAAINIRHVILDNNGRFLQVVDSDLNERLTLDANIDQTGRAFIQDVVMSLLDEGCVAIVPVRTDIDPDSTSGFKILELRTGRIVSWYPKHVKIDVYDQESGLHKEVIVSKSMVGIVENPLYSIMNEPNSTMQRLIRKLNLLDRLDDRTGSDKLDLIIQLPYLIRTKTRKDQAEKRRNEIEDQLSNSRHGIAYTDGTEKVIQLNRSIENNLLEQIEYHTNMLFSQLGITPEILNGTADEKTMLNYYNRTIEPIISAIVDEMKRKFLSKTARSQNKSIVFFRDPFKLVPVSAIAEISDKFTRNEIATANEIRQVIGWKPSDDPKADELRNSNIAAPADDTSGAAMPVDQNGDATETASEADYDSLVMEILDGLEKEVNDVIGNYDDSDEGDSDDE